MYLSGKYRKLKRTLKRNLDLERYSKKAAELSSEDMTHIKNGLAICRESGISFDDYIKYGYWNVPLGKLVRTHENSKGRKRIANEIAEAHHKDPDEIEKQMLYAQHKLDLRLPYFKKYEWDLLSDDLKEQMFLRPYSRILSRKYKTKDAKGEILNNKALFYEKYPEAIGRQWFSFDESMTLESFKDNVEKTIRTPYALYKPEVSYGGEDIFRFTHPEGLENVYEMIKTLGKGLVEEFVEQHDEMNRLCPDSVNTIRIVTLYWEGDFHIFYACCRMASGDGTYVDNVGRGGMAAGIDIETGKIYTYAADHQGNAVKVHPSTGTEIMGFQIPYWKEVLELIEKCSVKTLELAGLGYVGWDVAITPTGPIIIEGNNWPCPSLIQLCNYVTSKKGMKYLIDDYL